MNYGERAHGWADAKGSKFNIILVMMESALTTGVTLEMVPVSMLIVVGMFVVLPGIYIYIFIYMTNNTYIYGWCDHVYGAVCHEYTECAHYNGGADHDDGEHIILMPGLIMIMVIMFMRVESTLMMSVCCIMI